MENLSTLTGKYGDEGDQLLFKVLNSGDFMKKVPEDSLSSKEVMPRISEKGLRYDLTVPFARYVVSHQHELVFPFKRFPNSTRFGERIDHKKVAIESFINAMQILLERRPVWNEAELTLLIHEVFASLGLVDFSLKINHRQVLNAFAKVLWDGRK